MAAAGFEASEEAKRVRRLEGIPFKARTISSRPRRLAMRMVAELKLLVDASSSLRRFGGTLSYGSVHLGSAALGDEDRRCLDRDPCMISVRQGRRPRWKRVIQRHFNKAQRSLGERLILPID